MTKNPVRCGLVALATLAFPLLPTASAAEIPSGLERRGPAAGNAVIQVAALDAVELAELARSDPAQRGGDHDPQAVTTIVLITAVVILLLLL